MDVIFEAYRDNIRDWLPEMVAASLGTLKLTALSFLLAAAVGLVFALARNSRLRPVRNAAIVYIDVMRGTPIPVILFLIYFGLGSLDVEWLKFNSLTGGVVGLGIYGGAILAEVFRAGIEALHHGQMEAALSLGMTPAKAMGNIILPQAVRIVLPPVGNYVIGLLKDTSLCLLIAAPELMARAQDLSSSSFQPMAVYVLAAALYFVMSYPLSLAVRYMEARLSFGR